MNTEPAFPVTVVNNTGANITVGPALIGVGQEAVFLGMSLRDYFAAKAMLIVGAPNPVSGQFAQPSDYDAVALGAYLMADAMLKARGA